MSTIETHGGGDVEPGRADRDLRFVKEIVGRTHRRVDPHAFHYVYWGFIVLIWFPLANCFRDIGRMDLYVILGIVSLLVGLTAGTVREIRLSKKPRLEGENTFISRQICLIVAGCISTGIVLSALAPSFGFIHGPNVPIIWGLVYANLAFMTGVVLDRSFLYSGIFILLGSFLAIVFQASCGYILGPFMGLGMILPGLRAEKRVRKLLEEDGGRL